MPRDDIALGAGPHGAPSEPAPGADETVRLSGPFGAAVAEPAMTEPPMTEPAMTEPRVAVDDAPTERLNPPALARPHRGADDTAVAEVPALGAEADETEAAATEADGTAPGSTRTPGSKPAPSGAFARLRGSRASGAGILIAVLVGLLGFALVAQVKSNQSASNLSSDRPDDLVRILSDLDARKDRLNTEISTLQQTQQELQSGAAGKQAALAEAAKRADDLGILAGTIAAQGPGLRITLSPGSDPVGAADVLDMVEELRGAGAEAMEITGSGNGANVRIVASTYFVDTAGGILVDGQKLSGALTIAVIGDAQTMQTALSIPGGAVDTIKQHGGNVTMATPTTVQVTALRPETTPKYAQPAS